MKIDCTQCEMYRSDHCDDCLVSVLLHPMGGPVELEDDLGEPLRNLSGAGLIPVLKFRPRPGPEEPPTEEGVAETA
jgi:hypothetical protein